MALALRGRLGRGTDDPAAESGEVALLGAVAAIDQVPAHALGYRGREGRNKPAGSEIVVDIGPDAHGDAEPVGRGLQRLTIILKLSTACGDAGNAGGFQPERPV